MRLFFLALILFLGGCNAGYYWHLAEGHVGLMMERRPLDDVLADPALSDDARQKLVLTRQVLAFAAGQTGLPADGSYESYVPLERDWVVWNLFAAPEFSLTPHQWCYPVAGCVSYRGFFDRQRADREAGRLRERGLDVYAGGAIAYSTLGWFDDPLTTPMLRMKEAGLAELLFHELVHQRLYVSGDTRFNESLATAVAEEATRRWLAARGESGSAWRREKQARARVVGWIRETRGELRALYARELPEEQMRRGKRDILEALRRRYQQAAADAPALAAWEQWFQGPLNNAQLNTLLDYNDLKPAFDRLLLDCGGRWPCFWAATEELAGREPAARRQRLKALMSPQRMVK